MKIRYRVACYIEGCDARVAVCDMDVPDNGPPAVVFRCAMHTGDGDVPEPVHIPRVPVRGRVR